MKTILCFNLAIIILVSCSNAIQRNGSEHTIDNNPPDSFLAQEQQIDREHIIVKVDSISAPTNIKHTDRLIVKFYGTIHYSACAGLDSIVQTTTFFERTFVKKETLKFYAFRITDRRAICGAAMTTLGGFGAPYEREFFPTNRGEFIVSVQQPDGTVLEKIIYVD